MTTIERFLNRDVVVLIPNDYDEEEIETLQLFIDYYAGKDIRFARTGTILDWCQKRGRGSLGHCVAYDTDERLVWCDVDYYKDMGREIVSVGDMLEGHCVSPNLSEEDFDRAIEEG